MTTRAQTARRITGRGVDPVRLRRRPVARATRLALAGLLAALAFAGCSGGATTPTSAQPTSAQPTSAQPTSAQPAPGHGTFSATGSMTSARSGTAALLSGSRVLISGGYDGSADLASAELYQP